jgi:hypothetical protein
MTSLTVDQIPFASNTAMPDSWRLLDDVQIQALPDPTWIVDAVIPERAIVGLYGPSGACKTTSVAGLLVSVATGLQWFRRGITRQGNCIYIGAEDVPGFKIRLSAAKRAAGLSLTSPIGVFTFPEAIDLRDPVNVRKFVQLCRQSGDTFRIVVIDTFAASTPGSNENSSEDMTSAIVSAQLIRDELDVTVILVHHTNASGTRERGHSAMRGAADAMISLTPVDDVYHLECSKMRNGPPFEPIELKLTPVPDGGVVLRLNADVLPSATLTPAQGKALDALREAAGADGITKAAWRSICADMNERAFYKVAKVLEERRHVAKVGASHYRASGGVK